jgi:hypothetical protein
MKGTKEEMSRVCGGHWALCDRRGTQSGDGAGYLTEGFLCSVEMMGPYIFAFEHGLGIETASELGQWG